MLEDAGDSELWRHSRLRWLNSTIAIDDEVFGPYTPVGIDGQTVKVLGRRGTFRPRAGCSTAFRARSDIRSITSTRRRGKSWPAP